MAAMLRARTFFFIRTISSKKDKVVATTTIDRRGIVAQPVQPLCGFLEALKSSFAKKTTLA
jgi:hypothetical protein